MPALTFPLAGTLSRGLNVTRRWPAAAGGGFIWSPLFANGEQGAVYDFSDLSSLFQDEAGTIPVTAAGQPVGKILDLSGNGNHLHAHDPSYRPLLQTDGTHYYLDGDGIDDYLHAAAFDCSAFSHASIWYGVKQNVDSIYYRLAFGTNSSTDATGAWYELGYFGGVEVDAKPGNLGASTSATASGYTSLPEVFAQGINLGGLATPSTAFRMLRNGAAPSLSFGAAKPNSTLGTHPFTIFSYPAYGSYMNGRFYSRLIFRASATATSDADLLAISDWVNEVVGSY